MKGRYFIVLLSMPGLSVAGQDISRRQADSLTGLLKKNQPAIERIDILLQLAQFHIFKPGENQIDFDSATRHIDEVKRLNDTEKSPAASGYLLLTESYMVKEKGMGDSAKQMAAQSISLLKNGNNKYYLGKAYFEYSNYYQLRSQQEWEGRIDYVQKSIAAFQQSGHAEDKAYSMKMLGDLYLIGRKNTEGLEVLKQALAIYDSIGYKKVHGVCELISRAYFRTDDYTNALPYALRALKAAEESPDAGIQLAGINNTLGIIYRQTGRKDLAIKHLRDAHKVILRYGDRRSIAMTTFNVSAAYLDYSEPRQGLEFLETVPKNLLETGETTESAWYNLAYMNCHLSARQFKEAGKYVDVLLKFNENSKVPVDVLCGVYGSLAAYYLHTGNYNEARVFLDKNEPIIKKTPGNRFAATHAAISYKLDSALGNYRSAFEQLRIHKALSDSIFNENKAKQLQALEVEFGTARKADSIKFMDANINYLTRTNELQKANLEQADLIKNTTIVGIVLAVIIIGLLYWQYRQKQKSNKIISTKNGQLQRLVNEKEWLLKEVHHRVKNNLQTVVSLLELQSQYLSNEALSAVQASQNRIYATSLLHQKLYRSDNLSSVNMREYLLELIEHIKDAFHGTIQVSFRTNITPLDLDVSQAIPLGLIVNEVITNSFKYAFNHNPADPEIMLSLTISDGMADLLIADNGSGFEAVTSDTKSSLGLKLVKGLAEDIEGTAHIESGKGTRTLIRFKPGLSLETIINSKDALPA